MKCPKCHSDNVTIQIAQTKAKTKKHGPGLGGNLNNAARAITAISTLGISNIFWKKSVGTSSTSIKTTKLCICQNCGESWEI